MGMSRCQTFRDPDRLGLLTRNRLLVRLLLSSSRLGNCLKLATSNFFWEIADDILQYLQEKKEIPSNSRLIQTVRRPFLHWIAHGRDHIKAIYLTVQLCNDYGILDSSAEDVMPLLSLVLNARVGDDFALIESCLSVLPSAALKKKGKYGKTVLLGAVIRAKHKTIWRKTLLKLVENYTVEELQEKVADCDSYLHVAVSRDSVVGARVLLEKGVDVNQRSLIFLKQTPLHSCMSDHASTDMYSLLLEFGADANSTYQLNGLSPYQLGIQSRHMNFDLLDFALGEENNLGDSLHRILGILPCCGWKERQDALEAFRFLLGQDTSIHHINDVNESGATLLQRAAKFLDVDAMNLLLESKADARIAFTSGVTTILPLQIACVMGKIGLISRESPDGQGMRAMSFKLASELFQWHHAKGDSMFEGITLLHLASYMMNFDEVRRLIAAGYRREAKGRWPSIDHDVTPQNLLKVDFVDGLSEVSLLENSNPGDLDSDSLYLDPDFLDLLRLDFDFSDSLDSDSDFSDTTEDDLSFSTSRDWDMVSWRNLQDVGPDFINSKILETRQRISNLFLDCN